MYIYIYGCIDIYICCELYKVMRWVERILHHHQMMLQTLALPCLRLKGGSHLKKKKSVLGQDFHPQYEIYKNILYIYIMICDIDNLIMYIQVYHSLTNSDGKLNPTWPNYIQ